MLSVDLQVQAPSSRRALTLSRRPQLFAQVIGHAAPIAQLLGMVASEQLNHIIFVGPSGSGKTTLAKILAKLMNCTQRTGLQPCGACPSCRSLDEGVRHRTYHERNAAGRDGSKDELVDFLDNDLRFVPPGYRRHIVFFDEAQQLSSYAQDLLLKYLERDDCKVVFIFALIDEDRLPEAFQARCRIIRLEAPTVDEKLQGLSLACEEEVIAADHGALLLIAERSTNLRRAYGLLQQVRDAAGGGGATAELVRNTLFHDESNATVAFLSAALRGDMSAAHAAMAEMPGDAAACFRAVQRLLLFIKITIVGPQLSPPSRADLLLYDGLELATLIEPVGLIAARLGQSIPTYFDALLEHFAFTPPQTPEAFLIHAVRFVDLCRGTIEHDDPVERLKYLPAIDEGFRSTRRYRSPAVLRPNNPTAPANRDFLNGAQARSIYEACTFLPQVYGVTLNAVLSIAFADWRIGLEARAANLLTNVGRQLAQRARSWAGSRTSMAAFHRLSLLGRDPVGGLTGVLLCHLAPSSSEPAVEWIANWFTRYGREHKIVADVPQLQHRAPADPRNAIDRHARLVRRHLLATVDPALVVGGVPLVDRFGIRVQNRHPAGAIVGARLHFSESIGQAARARARRSGMAHLSAWEHGRWDQLFSGWELREHREREEVLRDREQRIALFEARRAATGDPLTRTLIDHLEQDERQSWLVDAIDRPRGRPCWPQEI